MNDALYGAPLCPAWGSALAASSAGRRGVIVTRIAGAAATLAGLWLAAGA